MRMLAVAKDAATAAEPSQCLLLRYQAVALFPSIANKGGVMISRYPLLTNLRKMSVKNSSAGVTQMAINLLCSIESTALVRRQNSTAAAPKHRKRMKTTVRARAKLRKAPELTTDAAPGTIITNPKARRSTSGGRPPGRASE